jgi:alkanesulfonate monooxygenase SsuD/methylene tetrahydromethanopterin reductase-like flavin-dependent oxidoreductase (luciferase family)
MKIGVSLTTSFPPSKDGREIGRQLVKRARVIREAGLDSLFVGDHHNTPGLYFQNVPTLARLLAEAGDMTTGALFLMPLHHPFAMAEQVGTLASFAEGDFVLIAALGDDESQFSPFGVSLRERPRRMEEHLEIVQRLLAGETLTYKGRYHDLRDARVMLRPQTPPTVWIGASATPALRRAAAMGDAWLASPAASGEQLETQANVYREAAARRGKRPVLTIRRDVYVGETDADAEDATRPILERGYRGFRREALLIGGPDTVVEELRHLRDLGFEHVLIRHVVNEQALGLASYRRLGSQVMPRVRDW